MALDDNHCEDCGEYRRECECAFREPKRAALSDFEYGTEATRALRGVDDELYRRALPVDLNKSVLLRALAERMGREGMAQLGRQLAMHDGDAGEAMASMFGWEFVDCRFEKVEG